MKLFSIRGWSSDIVATRRTTDLRTISIVGIMSRRGAVMPKYIPQRTFAINTEDFQTKGGNLWCCCYLLLTYIQRILVNNIRAGDEST